MDRFKTRQGSNGIGALLAITFGLLMVAAGFIGAAHHHHAAIGGDATCAVCLVSATAAATTLPAAVPAAPELVSEALEPGADFGSVSAAPRRASSRAPPSA